MAHHSFESHGLPVRLSSVFHGVSGISRRMIASWRRHRTERALEGLPFDTLKDIGFPSADTFEAKAACDAGISTR
ncbi:MULTISPECIES: hypothetical protein [unclassified Rhizobium]|uniref:hypothetical protein n=1 Tax=unclassified Rhizobium TaxID=2613769 RepID=UPI0006FD465D|nr:MULTISPECIES: hypothetical protein [unclassified Rhizobium]KQV34641.1 hypothetical protein ASC86_14020 [Rhizobium sp. Root1212]KRD23975.1 hypothetical protein ASE37_14015 [Rhizobium sp. Root268]